MNKNIAQRQAARKRRRYIFHDATYRDQKVYLVYSYNTEDVILMTDGPYKDEISAAEKMKTFLLKGYCAWMVSYND